MIDGKQCTIQFHVDDLKMSHVEQSVLDGVINKLNDKFGVNKKIAASYGEIHEYLGMTIDYSEDSTVKFTMYDYLEDIVLEAPDDMDGKSVTVASDHLFTVNDKCEKLDPEIADYYHRTVAGCCLRPRGLVQIYRQLLHSYVPELPHRIRMITRNRLK